ncbi:unnamed protein product [Prunus armeniaca]
MTNSEVSDLKEPRRKPCAMKLIELIARHLPTRWNKLHRRSGLQRHPSLHSKSITPFKGDSDPESHLRHFKSAMILYKADDALMCKVFVMTLRGAAQDWFYILPSVSIGNFKEYALIFAKEYTSYKTVRTHADHPFNLRKKPDESLRDYLRRFKAEKANIIGCNYQIASSAFKKGLPIEHELYRELAITPSQTLA